MSYDEAAILKSISQLYSRLFDHKPALQAELSQMKSFDDMKSCDQLFQECIKKQNASTGRVENSCRKASEVLPTLLTDVKAIEDRITSLKASKDTIKYDDILSSQRRRREESLKQFMAGMGQRSSMVNRKYDMDSNELRNRYANQEPLN